MILSFVFFFFLLTRRPPSFTSFPTRRSSDLLRDLHRGPGLVDPGVRRGRVALRPARRRRDVPDGDGDDPEHHGASWLADRKSTRLNSSHANISYAVFCLKKKKK